MSCESLLLQGLSHTRAISVLGDLCFFAFAGLPRPAPL